MSRTVFKVQGSLYFNNSHFINDNMKVPKAKAIFVSYTSRFKKVIQFKIDRVVKMHKKQLMKSVIEKVYV